MTDQNQKPDNLLGEKIFDSNLLCYICSGKPELSPGTIFASGYCQKCQGNGLFAVDRGNQTGTLKVGQLDGKPFVEAIGKEPDNPPAFPIQYESQNLDGSVSSQRWSGMTLLDKFAEAAFPTAIRENREFLFRDQKNNYHIIARQAYDLADAMLAERAKRGIK